MSDNAYNFDPAAAFANIKTHFSKWAADTHAENFVIGISGGKDSTVVAMLLVAIFGAERVYGVMLPNHSQSDIDDSIAVCDFLGLKHRITMNIGPATDYLEDEIHKNRKTSHIYLTDDCCINLPARIRMASLFAVGQCVNGRVINTSNLSEDTVGYATQFGDNAGCYAPIQGLTVEEVRLLGKWMVDNEIVDFDYSKFDDNAHLDAKDTLSTHHRFVRENFIAKLIYKCPIDGLQPNTDEERLGFTYQQLDDFIRRNKGDDDFKARVVHRYKLNKFKTDIVVMPQPDWSHLPNYVKDYPVI